MTDQKKKPMQMPGPAASNLHRVEAILPAVQALGRPHAGHGAAIADYEAVGAALPHTLRQGPGEDWRPELAAPRAETCAAAAAIVQGAARELA